ncbi:MAG: hypothetical protein SGARI_002611 [Bacillariaceae sp.]
MGPRSDTAHPPNDNPGGIPELKGKYFIYDRKGQEAQYIETMKAMAEWAVTQYDMGSEIYGIIICGDDPKFPGPADLSDEDEKKPSLVRRHAAQEKEAKEKAERLDKDKISFLMSTLGQCTRTMRRELDTMEKPTTLAELIKNKDVTGLYDAMKGIIFHTSDDGRAFAPLKQQDGWRRLVRVKQRPGQSIESHSEEFLAQCGALEELWGRLQPYHMVGNRTEEQILSAERFKAAMFLGSVDMDFLNSVDNYPTTVAATVTLLKRRKDVGSSNRGRNRSAMMFAQDVASNDEETRSEATQDEETGSRRSNRSWMHPEALTSEDQEGGDRNGTEGGYTNNGAFQR